MSILYFHTDPRDKEGTTSACYVAITGRRKGVKCNIKQYNSFYEVINALITIIFR